MQFTGIGNNATITTSPVHREEREEPVEGRGSGLRQDLTRVTPGMRSPADELRAWRVMLEASPLQFTAVERESAGGAAGYAVAADASVNAWRRFAGNQSLSPIDESKAEEQGRKDFSILCKNILTQAGRGPAQIESFLQVLESVFEETGFNNFETFIRRLRSGILIDLFKPEQLAIILEEVARSPETRALTFDATTEAAENCIDRVSTLLNNVLYLAQASRLLSEAKAPERVEDKMLDLSLGLFRATLLDEAVPKVILQQWQEGRRTSQINEKTLALEPNNGEALEVQIGLRVNLAERLSLPFQAKARSLEMARLNSKDLDLAAEYVKQRTDDVNATIAGLAHQLLWRNYLDGCYPQEVRTIKESFANDLVELDNKFSAEAPDIDRESNAYLNQANEISAAREKALTRFYEDKTRKIVERRQQKNNESPVQIPSPTATEGMGLKRPFKDIS